MGILRLRFSLADRAGALAQAATVVGLHGGNILSIDVHRTEGADAVDDVVVDFVGDPNLDDLRADLFASASTTLVAHRPADPTDPVAAALRLAAGLVGAGRDRLADAARELCAAETAWVDEGAAAQEWEAGRLALLDGTARVVASDSLPDRPTGDYLVLGVPVADGAVLLIGRGADLDFTETEKERVETLIALSGAD